MNKIILFVISLALFSHVFAGVPLNRAVENGILISADIKNNILESKILEVDHRIKQFGKLFNLTGGGSYLYRSEKTEIKMPDITIAPGMSITDLSISGGVFHSFDFKISLSQPIFTGNALSGLVKLNEIQQAMNLSNREFLELMLRGRIKAVFFNYQMLSSQNHSLNALGNRIGNHLKKLEDLYKEDLVGKSQVLETRLKRREITLSQEEIMDMMNRAASTFGELTGFEIAKIDNNYRETVRDRKTSLEIFLRNHPNLKVLADKQKMIGINKKITSGKNLPQVGGFAEFHYGVPGINFIGDEWNSYFQGGIEVKLNIFNWRRSRKENQINNYNIEKIDNRRKDLVRKTEIQLSDLFSTLQSLKARITTYNDMLAIAGEESELKLMMFNERQISNKDYIDSVLNVENLRSLKEKTDLQAELIKVEINTMIGRKEEI